MCLTRLNDFRVSEHFMYQTVISSKLNVYIYKINHISRNINVTREQQEEQDKREADAAGNTLCSTAPLAETRLTVYHQRQVSNQ